jgi:hypothetical protein
VMFVTGNKKNPELEYRPYPPWGDTDDILVQGFFYFQ